MRRGTPLPHGRSVSGVTGAARGTRGTSGTTQRFMPPPVPPAPLVPQVPPLLHCRRATDDHADHMGVITCPLPLTAGQKPLTPEKGAGNLFCLATVPPSHPTLRPGASLAYLFKCAESGSSVASQGAPWREGGALVQVRRQCPVRPVRIRRSSVSHGGEGCGRGTPRPSSGSVTAKPTLFAGPARLRFHFSKGTTGPLRAGSVVEHGRQPVGVVPNFAAHRGRGRPLKGRGRAKAACLRATAGTQGLGTLPGFCCLAAQSVAAGSALRALRALSLRRGRMLPTGVQDGLRRAEEITRTPKFQ